MIDFVNECVGCEECRGCGLDRVRVERCDVCGEIVSGKAYQIDHNRYMCEACAVDYCNEHFDDIDSEKQMEMLTLAGDDGEPTIQEAWKDTSNKDKLELFEFEKIIEEVNDETV